MIFGALAVILTVLTLVFLIIPLLREPTSEDSANRDQQNIDIAKEKKRVLEQQLAKEQMSQQEFDAAMVDLERSLAIDLERQQSMQSNQHAGKWAMWFFIAFVPVASVYFYWQWGSYQVIENPELAQARTQTQNAHAAGQANAPSMEELIQKVKDHLKQNPEDVRGWFMLGRTYLSMQQYPEAVTALQRSYDLSQQEPAVMLALADALAMNQDGNMAGQSESLVLKALQLVPSDPTALWLAGLAAEQGGRHREAFDHWTKLLPLLDEDPQSADEVKLLLTTLKSRHPELPELAFAQQNVTAGKGIVVSVALDEKFNSEVTDESIVFVYAKAASGPPMPLAAKRLTVADLPIKVMLDDDDAMLPEMVLSGFDEVILGARISRTGNPVSQAGDLYVESAAVQRISASQPINLTIDTIKQ